MGRQRRIVDHIVEQLVAADCEYIFGVDGANIEDLFDAAYCQDGITAILAKHEFSAATMADGYSRAGCGLGVAAATSGGGALNLIPGLAESLASRIPVLALVGQAPTALDGRGSFQDTSGANGALDAEALFSRVAVFCRRIVSPDQIETALPEAITAARRGGPAVLLLPKDIQQAPAPIPGCVVRATPHKVFDDPWPIVHMLRRASGPVTIIAGEQIARDDARAELELLRSVLGARVATVPDAKDVSDLPGRDYSSALGVTGVMGHPRVAAAIAASELCLLIGTRMNITARAGLEEALASTPLVSIGSAAPFLPCTHVRSEDLRTSLAQLVVSLSQSGRKVGMLEVDCTGPEELTPPRHEGDGIRYREAILALDAALPDAVDIVVDAGNTGAAAVHHLAPRRGGRFIVALGMGGMGYSFGAAVGMALGRSRQRRPGNRIVVLAGDGSFLMHGMEIHTAVRYRLPITFVLFNNNAHAMCLTRERLYLQDQHDYNRFQPSRLGAGLAAMFPGLPAVDVDSPAQLRPALTDALAARGPSVVSVECSADEIPPFAPFLAALANAPKESPANVAART